jgi:23S rRNA (guanosine2251-2'-O)-methyltransferase
MAHAKPLYGFHAVLSRLRSSATSIRELYVEGSRHDGRMKELIAVAQSKGVQARAVDAERLAGLAGPDARHQGVVALADEVKMPAFIEEVLDGLSEPPLLLLLDGVTDPHNLGACLRVADAARCHAVIAPKDRSVGLTAAAAKVASGAAETVPYIMVTNLARTMRDLKERNVWLVGADEDADASLYDTRLDGAIGWVLGAEGEGLRRLTRDSCDLIASIPMLGSVESLNVSVASGVCLFETRRRRLAPKK